MGEYNICIIIQKRQAGASLQQIAECFGISRERVRQLLVRRWGSTQVSGFLTTVELQRQSHCNYAYVQKLTLRGVIKPAKIIGNKRKLWKPETVDIVVRYIASHRCPVCNGPLPSNRSIYCSQACYTETYRHRYVKMSLQERKKHNERVRRWEKKSPEKAREIRRRKQKAYSARKSNV